MNILYDHQVFTFQKYGGISRYFYEIIKLQKKSFSDKIITPLIFSNNEYISKDSIVKHRIFFKNFSFFGKDRLMRIINKANSIYYLKNQKFDIFHPTYFDTYFLDYLIDKPFVITIYDMIHERFKEILDPNDLTSITKKELINKATRIIAISENTKKDIIDIYGIKEDKIDVVYLANSINIIKNKRLDIFIPKRYILFVGSRRLYKNFTFFIKSISCILLNDRTLNVVCIGGGEFDDDETNIFKNLNIKDQLYQFDIEDSMMGDIYSKAELFAFPSLYEGFGIPLLEAFATNCPVICSNTSCFPEIALDAAEYFDPTDKKSIESKVLNLLNNFNLRETLKLKGQERLKYFSWDKCALDTRKVYEKTLCQIK